MRWKYLILALTLWGCAGSKIKSDDSIPEGARISGVQWETKAQVRDYRKNKTNNLSIDVVAAKNRFLRMEVSATLGYPVASIVSTPETIKMAVYTQKKFYYGSNKENSLSTVFGFPISSQILQQIVYDSPISGWKCELGEDKMVKACKQGTKQGDIVVAWQERKPNSKRVVIQGPKFEMQWLFKNSSVIKSVKAEVFKLESPKGYKVVPL